MIVSICVVDGNKKTFDMFTNNSNDYQHINELGTYEYIGEGKMLTLEGTNAWEYNNQMYHFWKNKNDDNTTVLKTLYTILKNKIWKYIS